MDAVYVIYSHDHADHTSGGEVFADNAAYTSHIRASEKISDSGRTAIPDVVFETVMGMSVGGKEIWLYFPGKSHSDNLIVVYFPAERALFVVDVASVRRLPFRTFGDYHFPDTLETFDFIEEIDFDILVPGHGPIGTKQDLIDHHAYVSSLHQQVSEAIANGLSLEETKAAVDMSDYSDWGQYENWLPLNIEGLYALLSEG